MKIYFISALQPSFGYVAKYEGCRVRFSVCVCVSVCVVYLYTPVQRSTGKLVVVFGVEDDVHHIVTVTPKHLNTRPLFLPVPQLDQHVI